MEHVYAASYKETENNDYMSSADVINISSGNTYSGNLADYDDKDFIKFTLTQGSEVDLNVYGSKPKNISKFGNSIMLDFYKSSNTSKHFYYTDAVYDYNLGYINANETIYLSEGTYYVKLYEQFTDEKISYKLTFNTYPIENFKEPNNYISSATNIVEGKKYYGLLESYDKYNSDYEYDFFVFDNPAKGNYYLVVKNVNVDGYNFAVQTFDQSGKTVDLLEGESYLNMAMETTNTIIISLPAGKTYFRFDSYVYSGKYEFAIVKVPAAPKSLSIKLYGHDDIKATWSAVDGATGYYVYYKKSTSSGYSYLGAYTGTSANIKNLTDGAKYYVKVVPYRTTEAGTFKGYSKTSPSLYTLKKLSTPKVSKNGSKVKVKWSNISGETGYQISKSTKKTGTSIVSTYKTTKGAYKNISAKKGKTYYYKVRAYKVVDGKKIYGPWSAVKAYKR